MCLWMVAMVTCSGCNALFSQARIHLSTAVTLNAVEAVDGQEKYLNLT